MTTRHLLQHSTASQCHSRVNLAAHRRLCRPLILTAATTIWLVTACGGNSLPPTLTPTPVLATPTPRDPAAAEYCRAHGGQLQVIESPIGPIGYCLFPNGSQCEAGAYYRGECAPAAGTAISPPTADAAIPNMFQPLPTAACRHLADRLGKAAAAEFVLTEANFVDQASNQSGRGCQATATLSSASLSWQTVFEQLKQVLIADGWGRAVEYPLTGTGAVAIFIRRTDMCQLSVAVESSGHYVLTANCAQYTGNR